MQKRIALIMDQRFIGEALAELLRAKGRYEVSIVSDFERALGFFRELPPTLALVEVSDAIGSQDKAMKVCGMLKDKIPDCRRMLFLSASNNAGVLATAIAIKRMRTIDDFVTADAGIGYVIASIEALV